MINCFVSGERVCIDLIYNQGGSNSLTCCIAARCGVCQCEIQFVFLIKGLPLVYVFEENSIHIWMWLFEHLPVNCGASGTSSFFLSWRFQSTFWLVIFRILCIFYLVIYLKVERCLLSQCLIYDSIIWAACCLPVICNWLQKRHSIFFILKSTLAFLLNMYRTIFSTPLFFLLFLQLLLAEHIAEVARNS